MWKIWELKLFFQDSFLRQNAPLETWNGLFWNYHFFPLHRSFLPVSEKVWNRIVFFKCFMRSSWSSALEECSLENTDDVFTKSPKTFGSKPDKLPPDLIKKVFSTGKFSSNCLFGHVKHVKCKFVNYADIFLPKILLLVTNVQNNLKPTDFFWKVNSSNCFFVYVRGCVNCSAKTSLQKSGVFHWLSIDNWLVIDLFDKQLRWGNLCSPLECSSDNVPEVFLLKKILFRWN